MGSIPTYGVTHIHLLVSDAERAAAFYAQVFGCTELFREEFETERLIFVNTPGSRDLITLHERDGGVAEHPTTHFGIRLVSPDDADAAADAIVAAGGTIRRRGEHAPGEPFLDATDTEGNDFQLWYQD